MLLKDATKHWVKLMDALLFRERCFQQQSKGSPVAVAILWPGESGGREREGGRNFAGLIKISCTISCIVEVGAS